MTPAAFRRHIPRILHQHSALSTVESGTAYEHHVIRLLTALGASLERIGGASDQGIDFRGKWKLPSHPPFYMVGQCKHYERKKIGPSVVREWEGVMSRQEPDTLGLVAATSGFTRSGISAALSSAFPIALATIQQDLQHEQGRGAGGNIRGFVWNRAAEPFIGRMMVVKKHYDVRLFELVDPAQFTIQLLWDGKPL
ncbi:hypothetical protein GGI15_001855 [Coemansia interrupta]|uniref:Restriction endonuclease type IV Mrr domain-containing protein n=1 Tax=Coemansia interrupta TaxID=1126814 RepID=A0A9W8HI25_9FUNG|nr:hypothetical protein GGI15_001855 [Coemansia interrupta]